MQASWATPVGFGYALLIGALALLGGALAVGVDAVALVLVLVAVAGLVFAGASALRLRPRLAVHDNLLTVRTLTGRQSYAPDEVYRIRVLSLRHIGRRSSQLELDLATPESTAAPQESAAGLPPDNSRLVVFGRWDLGEDPHAVAQTLARAGFPVDDADRGDR
ncbi:MAG: PH domain-containing protein [Gordonia sp. (in: high G+C Gram-positive bacteria)]|uniref:PH domain-containing protein n=1 Tax=Gordonia sp. (in: high G+C Gram-positive bacteria) TaxID=84139 RepID=UPI0039E33510